MKPFAARLSAAVLCAYCGAGTSLSWAAETGAPQAPQRIEARSATLLAVGIVHADHMRVHLSQLLDNAPVRDATVNVLLRGVLHPTTAEADGSYDLQTKDLQLPGTAAVEFRVAQSGVTTTLKGVVQGSVSESSTEDKNSARQMGWWVLNFSVCIGFLMLLSRRRKAAARSATGD